MECKSLPRSALRQRGRRKYPVMHVVQSHQRHWMNLPNSCMRSCNDIAIPLIISNTGSWVTNRISTIDWLIKTAVLGVGEMRTINFTGGDVFLSGLGGLL